MTCPRCSVSEISPVTGRCDLCGYSVVATVATESADALGDLAKRQLAHEFSFGDLMGRGKESVVYRARERGSGRDVVLKAILRRNAEPEVAESFRAVMATLTGFDHPHLVPILRHGSTDSLFWFATEYRGDVSLAFKMRAEGPLDLKACRRVLTQLVGALDYLHRHGLVHGAVKSENVFVDREGWVRLGDPNFVRPRWRRPANLTPAIAQPAVPEEPVAHWVAPEEQARGERQPAADQYALAVLAVECLVGSEAETSGMGEALAHIGREFPPRIRRTLERALDEIPTRRYPTVTDFLWALEEDAAAAVAAPARRVTSDVMMVKDWEPPEDPKRRLRLIGRVSVGLIVMVAIAAVMPAARDLLWPEPVVMRSAPSPNPMTPPIPATAAVARPEEAHLESPRPATPEPVRPRAEVREPTRVVPPSSIARPRATPANTPSNASSPTSSNAPSTTPSTTPSGPPAAAPSTPAPAAGSATLIVNASPWGQVFVDGVLIGNTPRPNVALTAGSHTIRVSRAGFATWERTIRVAAGETVRFTDIVLTPDRP